VSSREDELEIVVRFKLQVGKANNVLDLRLRGEKSSCGRGGEIVNDILTCEEQIRSSRMPTDAGTARAFPDRASVFARVRRRNGGARRRRRRGRRRRRRTRGELARHRREGEPKQSPSLSPSALSQSALSPRTIKIAVGMERVLTTSRPFGLMAADDAQEPTMSRTHQYRKVMKPLLERKRRARINKCLDDLKDLMVFALQSEGESITKLEKADVLEITVRHLQKLKRQRMLRASSPSVDLDRYRSGFTSCASEVSRCLASIPGVDVRVGTALMSHLGARITSLEKEVAPAESEVSSTIDESARPLSSPTNSSDNGYNSGRDSASPTASDVDKKEAAVGAGGGGSVWRPF